MNLQAAADASAAAAMIDVPEAVADVAFALVARNLVE